MVYEGTRGFDRGSPLGIAGRGFTSLVKKGELYIIGENKLAAAA